MGTAWLFLLAAVGDTAFAFVLSLVHSQKSNLLLLLIAPLHVAPHPYSLPVREDATREPGRKKEHPQQYLFHSSRLSRTPPRNHWAETKRGTANIQFVSDACDRPDRTGRTADRPMGRCSVYRCYYTDGTRRYQQQHQWLSLDA